MGLAHKAPFRLLCSSVFCAFLLAQQAQATPQAQAWKLCQTSSTWGACTVYISKDAIRINAQNRDFYVQSRAPKWNVEIVNDKKKKTFIADTTWSGFSLHRICSNLGQIKEYKEQKDTFMTLPATVYSSNKNMLEADATDFIHTKSKKQKPNRYNTCYTVVQCKNVATPAALLLNQFYDMPRGSLQVPISLLYFNDGGKQFRLLTKEIKQVAIDPTIFAAKNYPKAARAEELILAAPADITEDMLIDSGLY